jgi:hypothetical protein
MPINTMNHLAGDLKRSAVAIEGEWPLSTCDRDRAIVSIPETLCPVLSSSSFMPRSPNFSRSEQTDLSHGTVSVRRAVRDNGLPVASVHASESSITKSRSAARFGICRRASGAKRTGRAPHPSPSNKFFEIGVPGGSLPSFARRPMHSSSKTVATSSGAMICRCFAMRLLPASTRDAREAEFRPAGSAWGPPRGRHLDEFNPFRVTYWRHCMIWWAHKDSNLGPAD